MTTTIFYTKTLEESNPRKNHPLFTFFLIKKLVFTVLLLYNMMHFKIYIF